MFIQVDMKKEEIFNANIHVTFVHKMGNQTDLKSIKRFPKPFERPSKNFKWIGSSVLTAKQNIRTDVQKRFNG